MTASDNFVIIRPIHFDGQHPLDSAAHTHIILINWNSFDKTRRCLGSLEELAQAPDHVWVIDNGSTDNSASGLENYLKKSPLSATLVRSGQNFGFGGGCNIGIQRAMEAGADSFWLLNNDAIADTHALQSMQEALHSDPRIGAVGSVIYDLHKPESVEVWGGGQVLLWAGLATHFHHPVAAARLDYITGASLLLRRQALQDVGLFDEDQFFMYWEDTDLCLRLRRRGWKLTVAALSRIWHEHSSSLGRAHPLKDYYVTRSTGAFLQRYTRYPRVAWAIGTSLRLFRRLCSFQPANWPAIHQAWTGQDYAGEYTDYAEREARQERRQQLRIAIEANTLQGKRAGIGHYAEQLCAALAENPKVRLSYFTANGWSTRMPSPAGLHIPKRFASTWKKKIPMGRSLQLILQQWQLRKLSQQWHPDVILGINYILPKTARPTVLVVHDLSHLRHPEMHPPGRVRFLQKHLRPTLARTNVILTISRFSKQELLHYFPELAGRIRVIYPGIAERFRQPSTDEQQRALRAALGGETRRYFLFLSTLEPRKNVERLLRAYALLPDNVKSQHPLVMVGQMGWQESRFAPMLDALIQRGEVLMPGYLRDELLPALYQGAQALLYPSLYEGFGLPPIEAMACGCPVLVSQVTAMPEVCGDAAIYCDPLDEASIRRGILQLQDDALCQKLAAQGRAHAARFTWRGDKTAALLNAAVRASS
ncbi:glycosyl transferase family 1 [Acidithiobacillus marinus]|uniref:Glycosyl transferase family 1 n=2 Tax=Acidithiobacillus marinus TaxID=187490 RepID=A0A2I1DNY0_9PROT|nr:glycosyl transferase family 1 [Acidithiobacillus marinus]